MTMAEVCCGLPWAAVVVQKDIYAEEGYYSRRSPGPPQVLVDWRGPVRQMRWTKLVPGRQSRAAVGCERPNCTPGDN